jgi:hypothetical protein
MHKFRPRGSLCAIPAEGRRPKLDAKSSESSEKKKKAVNAEYQKALQQIPDSEEKPDPWRGVRSH